MADLFLGQEIDSYIVYEALNSGHVGSVYLAKNAELNDIRAIKFVEKGIVDSKPGWEEEIKKVIKLKQTEGVVHFHKHGFVTISDKNYLYMMWDYIESENLKSIIDSSRITLQLLINVIDRSLCVFHACSVLGIQHSDFHSGNVLIQYPDPLSIDSDIRKVWITDFGYGTFSNETPPMDDYKGLARIIEQSIRKIDFHKLEREEKQKYSVLKDEFPKYLLEVNATEGDYVRSPSELRRLLVSLFNQKESEDAPVKAVGDYLATELIGDRYDEWEALFVPKFLAADELFDRNICVLTGLRGCGKTMMFRRLSEPLVSRLGAAGIEMENSFIGFYLNARTIAEAFPWLPEREEKNARKQVINYFHLRWTVEILEWLKSLYNDKAVSDIEWVIEFILQYFKDLTITSSNAAGVFNDLLNACYFKINESKLESKYINDGDWSFSDYSYLESFLTVISDNCSPAHGKAFYLFLDDYSTPMVTETTQIILNPVVFRRSPIAFFKVSTESIESFSQTGLNGKTLEEGADYKLIELGIESINRNENENKDIILSIFSKRIERNNYFRGKGLSLNAILGDESPSNTRMAEIIRENDKDLVYYGVSNFFRIWSSDIRELIKIFADMVALEGDRSLAKQAENGFVNDEGCIVSKRNQDKVYREAGGRFLHLLAVATNPSGASIYTSDGSEDSHTYGKHLYDIVTAFQEIAYYDLKNKNSKNQDSNPPKQARKIELVTANGDLSQRAREYYRGLIRYGVFIQDYRAKSIRGTASTRLFFRSLLIPYCRLTFSKRDCISLEWSDFDKLLSAPDEFKKEYISKQKKKDEDDGDEKDLFDLVGEE